ncbi:TPA: penicillin-binding protein activator LpoB, partial [Pseudomonas aeruginosa]|nr:penicillin-binding protein activator LpoB [Pseudomonas aeruginosa]
VLEPASGRVLWSTSGARAGWSRESLAGAAQKVLRELVGDLRLE